MQIVGTCRHLPTNRNKRRLGYAFLDCHHHPRRQLSSGFEQGVPIIPPDMSDQLVDRVLGDVRAEPFKRSDDITREAVAEHQQPLGRTADLDDLVAEFERPRAAVGQVDLTDGNLRGQPQCIGRRRATRRFRTLRAFRPPARRPRRGRAGRRTPPPRGPPPTSPRSCPTGSDRAGAGRDGVPPCEMLPLSDPFQRRSAKVVLSPEGAAVNSQRDVQVFGAGKSLTALP